MLTLTKPEMDMLHEAEVAWNRLHDLAHNHGSPDEIERELRTVAARADRTADEIHLRMLTHGERP